MKTSLLPLGLLSLWLSVAHSLAAVVQGEPTVTERGPHHRVWERSVQENWPGGKVVTRKSGYTEIAVGMHYWKDGQWLESKELIELFQDGAIARQGQIQAIFANNIATPGAIDVLMPDGKRWRTHVLGIAVFDSGNGNSQLIGDITDSIGELHPPNVIIYPDAVDFANGARASVRFTYSRDRFEQDIILLNRIDLPAGFNPASSSLEVWTEAVDFVEPSQIAGQINGLADVTLDFGAMRIGMGRAVTLEDPQGNIWSEPMCKRWIQSEGRTFLIESVPYLKIKDQLDALPPGQGAAVKRANRAQQMAALKPGQRVFPATPKAAKAGKIQTASIAPSSPFAGERAQASGAVNAPSVIQAVSNPSPGRSRGLVLDYVTVTTKSNMTFNGDTTYYVSGSATLSGTTTFEGGSVIKCTNAPVSADRLVITGPINCQSSSFRPLVITGKDDDSLGEVLENSTGNATTNYYGKFLDFAGNTNAIDLHDLRIRHAYYGVNLDSSSDVTLRHSQLTTNYAAVVNGSGGRVRLRNVLVYDGRFAFGSAGSNHVEHCTFHRLTNFRSSGYTNAWLTNSLIISVTNNVAYTGVGVVTNINEAGYFQSLLGGDHYLASNSSHRNAGTTEIDSNLLSELKYRTTYPPISLSSNTISADATLWPQAERDGKNGDTPDLGYHYDPLDFIASGTTIASNVTLTVANGAAIGVDYSVLDGSGNGWGFILNSGRFISQGSATASNIITRAHAVQEGALGNPGTRACFYDGNTAGNGSCEVRTRFTEFHQLSGDGYMVYAGTKCSALEWTHSRIYNPSLVVDASTSGTLICGVTNSYWERGGAQFGVSGAASNGVTVHLRNNLYRNFYQHFIGGNTNWTVRDNLFDTMYTLDDHSIPVQNSYNAYYPTNTTNFNLSGGTSNIALTNLTYEIGSLGLYYLPTNSLLINLGSRTADLAGLWHFTTTTNQVKETNSPVDIGLHWVAVYASGQPIDSDSDGWPDYLEDANGNGSLDHRETKPNDPADWGLRVFITRPRNGSTIP
jgi:hypothetical protein